MTELSLMERFADPTLIHQMSGSELLEGALITTMMGMGITFVVLTLLWGIISFVTKLINKTEKKEVKPIETPAAVTNVAPVPIEAPTTNAAAETGQELIAVIAAAIAAMEGSASANGLVIRKISRISGSSPSWNKAGRSESIDSRKL